jgi:hypothetical protein
MDDDHTPDHIVNTMNAAFLRKAGETHRMIYIHGKPYPDPGDDTQPEPRESPFPWDLWHGH